MFCFCFVFVFLITTPQWIWNGFSLWFICISHIINNGEHLSMCLSTLCVPFLKKCPLTFVRGLFLIGVIDAELWFFLHSVYGNLYQTCDVHSSSPLWVTFLYSVDNVLSSTNIFSMFICWFSSTWKAEWESKREREGGNVSSICWSASQMPTTSMTGPGWRQKPRTPFRAPPWGTGTHVIRHHLVPAEGALAGSWTLAGTVDGSSWPGVLRCPLHTFCDFRSSGLSGVFCFWCELSPVLFFWM